MPTEGLPTEVADFLTQHIDSVVQLEVLLRHSRAKIDWAAVDVPREPRIDAAWTEPALSKLTVIGVLTHAQETYRFSPASPQLRQIADTLARTYADRRVSVVSLIYSRAPDEIRQFTDAFRFRKGEGGNS